MLPARVPTLLVNGSSGIAVGIATRIPPHNLREVVAGLHALIDDPAITSPSSWRTSPGPTSPRVCSRACVCVYVCVRCVCAVRSCQRAPQMLFLLTGLCCQCRPALIPAP